METFDSHGRKVPLEVFQAGGGKHPAIIVAYGTDGMNDPFGKDIRSFASGLAGKGYVILLPHYFDRTCTSAGLPAYASFGVCRDTWVETLGDALSNAVGRSDVQGDRVGLLGFSMGGHLALRRAKASIGIKVDAVVEFFAPITQPPFNDLGGPIDKLPPTQIHHGEADPIVSPQQSRELEKMLIAAGKRDGQDYEIWFYPGEGHGFQGSVAIDTSMQRTVDFFDKHIRS